MIRTPRSIAAALSAESGNAWLQSSTAPNASGPSRAGWSLCDGKNVA